MFSYCELKTAADWRSSYLAINASAIKLLLDAYLWLEPSEAVISSVIVAGLEGEGVVGGC
jgi:hypothetical protein